MKFNMHIYVFLFLGIKSRKNCSNASLNIDERSRRVSLDPISKHVKKNSSSLGALPTDTSCNTFSRDVFETLGLSPNRVKTSNIDCDANVKKESRPNSGSSTTNLEDIEVCVHPDKHRRCDNVQASKT